MRTRGRPDIDAQERLELDWSAKQRDAFLGKVKVVDIERLDEPYPIDGYYVAGTAKAKRQWDAYWRVRWSVKTFDKRRLRYIIPQDESVIFRDAETKQVVFVVLRDFLADEAVRESMISVCKELTNSRRDDRREDPGRLTHFGYTAGSRHDRQIQTAAPNTRQDTAPKRRREAQLSTRAQGMAGIIWNLMRSKFSAEIIADYNDLIAECDFPRMDLGRDDETFTFSIDGKDVTFRDLELPPPSGLTSINYARHTHNETNGNKWVIAFTANAPRNPNRGGNFYLASYGIMLEPASNTATAWQSSDYHGTTLYEMKEGPERRAGFEVRMDGDFSTGMVFEISKALRSARLESAWLDRRRAERDAWCKNKAVLVRSTIVSRERTGMLLLRAASKQTRYSLRSIKL
ncbi:hypothetical protein F5Y17DRAFT_468965 [Xylariaceae sp. FL0594]|nr:hypothetical protein F5Y17DRAFT_468965 [Xylariaceae sp. FL0594]